MVEVHVETNAIAGIILAGGQSRWLGGNKACGTSVPSRSWPM
jgi:molybdopterin-guanine dinucleotide biosynthesis protein A